MKAADTSTVVAAFASWHEKHPVARRALDGRAPPRVALRARELLGFDPIASATSRGRAGRSRFLAQRSPQPLLLLGTREYRDFVLGLAERRVTGGAAYDALVAATVASAGGELVSCDRRALPIYEQYGVRVDII